MTVEFALVAPVVVVLAAACVSAVTVGVEAIHLADAAGATARAMGRGDDSLASEIVARLAPDASVSAEHSGLVCIRLDRAVVLGPLGVAVPLTARSCAPEGGE